MEIITNILILATVQALTYLWLTNSPIPAFFRKIAENLVNRFHPIIAKQFLFIFDCPFCFCFWLSFFAVVPGVGFFAIPLALINAYLYNIINY